MDKKKFKDFNFEQLTEKDKQNIFDGRPPLDWQKKILSSLKRNFGVPVQRKPDPIFSIGSVASSGSLIRDTSILIKWLQTARGIRAFEMEAAGVFQAAEQLKKQYPVMTIRGISDIPGLIRDDGWKRYACHSAAAFTYAFIKAGIVDPVGSGNEGWPASSPSMTSSNVAVSQPHPPTVYRGDKSKQAVRVYISYSEGDEELKDELGIHLALLQRQGIISSWDNHQIGDITIENYIDNAQIILLLVSPRFIAAPQYYENEVLRAMQRRQAGGVYVVPIILRPVDWRNTLFGQLQPLPRNNKPIVSWKNRDEAWYEIVTELRKLSESLQNGRAEMS